MSAQLVFQFLTQLKENNTREWFTANRKWYEQSRAEVESVATKLIAELSKIDPSIGSPQVKDCMFRINRDIRFSNDKSPYKTNFGAFVAKGGRKSTSPGYYIHVEPGACMLAGGIYMPPPDVLKLLRNEIYFNADEFVKIIESKDFKKYFGVIDDFDKLKKPPKDFPADFPHIDLLKYRSYTVIHGISDETLLRNDFVDYALQAYKAMLPFHAFLNKAIWNK